MSSKWRKGQKCWVIRPCDNFPAVTKAVVTSSVHADTLRVRWKAGSQMVYRTIFDTDAYSMEEEALAELVRRLRFEISLLEARITDVRYEQGPMEVSK